MTINDQPAAEEDGAASGETGEVIESITPPPDDVPPQVSIGLPGGTVAAGLPTTVTLFVDRGTSWEFKPPNSWRPVPAVTFSQLVLTIPGIGQTRDNRSSVNDPRTDFSITFPSPGTYQISGCGTKPDGTEINAHPRSLTVISAGPPAFTWQQPVNGTVVDIGPNSGQLTVELSSGTDQLYPWTVAVTCDGVTTSEPYSGTHYVKTINLAKTPLGTRSVTVTCTDQRGQATTQTRSFVAHDGAPPTVTLDPFTSPQPVSSLPFPFVLTGRTPGAQSGVTKVEYAFGNGGSKAAENTGPGGDWSTWRVTENLPTTGTFQFSVTATDSRGGTASASSSITVQLAPPGTKPAPKPAPVPAPKPGPGPTPLPPRDQGPPIIVPPPAS